LGFIATRNTIAEGMLETMPNNQTMDMITCKYNTCKYNTGKYNSIPVNTIPVNIIPVNRISGGPLEIHFTLNVIHCKSNTYSYIIAGGPLEIIPNIM